MVIKLTKTELLKKIRSLTVGPSFSGEAYLEMTQLKNIFTSVNFDMTRSSEKFNDNCNTVEKARDKGENEGGIVFYDDMLLYTEKAIEIFLKEKVK